jgi:hypothetical protein
MSQKFYQKASVQVAIVTAIGLIIVTIITIAHQRSKLKSDNIRLQSENVSKTIEIQRLETLLTPFRTIALEKYTLPEAEALRKLAEQLGVLQDADKQKTENITQLENELIQIKALAEPCKLAFLSKKIETVDQGYRVTLRFKPTKNERLGLLVFYAVLPVNTDKQILDFWPSSKRPPFTSGKDSKKIENDGKSARLMYSLLGFGYPSFVGADAKYCNICPNLKIWAESENVGPIECECGGTFDSYDLICPSCRKVINNAEKQLAAQFYCNRAC